jgi:solute carrier family 13 (sodium-dependent dicarboxylate transporter), member 2/3/5
MGEPRETLVHRVAAMLHREDDALDTRAGAWRIYAGPIQLNIPYTAIKIAISLLIAVGVAWGPAWQGLSDPGHRALCILLFATGLWVTEAIPTFATGLVVIALSVAMLGNPKGQFAAGDRHVWEIFVSPWGSPLLWLFMGGFGLAAAASKTGLDRWAAIGALGRVGTRPGAVVAGIMAIAFVGSMFMSNTAMCAMVIAMIAPLVARLGGDPIGRAMVLAATIGANLGGMATILGTPPNAIAAGALSRLGQPISFGAWIVQAGVPALALAVIAWLWLLLRYRTERASLDVVALLASGEIGGEVGPGWHRAVVGGALCAAIVLWMTGSWHGIPAEVVAIMPLALFAALGILNERDVRAMSWDVLLLLAGGLTLGVVVSETGLARWMLASLPLEALGPRAMALAVATAACGLSNVMSNTAAANILIPLAAAMASAGDAASLVIPVALGTSGAMCLPVSTPPNAIAYGTGLITTRDLLEIGLLLGVLTPLLAVGWGLVGL